MSNILNMLNMLNTSGVTHGPFIVSTEGGVDMISQTPLLVLFLFLLGRRHTRRGA